MKSYKEFEKQFIGSSDIAALVLVGPTSNGVNPQMLNFVEDGDYFAYMVDEEIDIPKHYELKHEFSHWLRIYDDDALIEKIYADKIKVYRAGDFGCIIQFL